MKHDFHVSDSGSIPLTSTQGQRDLSLGGREQDFDGVEKIMGTIRNGVAYRNRTLQNTNATAPKAMAAHA